jgi:SAM-dependent methyltransferase
MVTDAKLTHGDFTNLAENYSKYREGYAPSVLHALIGLLRRPVDQLDAVDVGAGTGIWTRMLAHGGFRSVTAVEPNDVMRATGARDSSDYPITWRAGSGERSGLPDGSADLISMASSFHWVDFDQGTAEFRRVLRPAGWFVALWNPRYLDDNPRLLDIEAELTRLEPSLRRVTSARPEMIDDVVKRFVAHEGFDDVVTLEGRHVSEQTVADHLGLWRSVNDVRVQLGEERFERFLDYARDRLSDSDSVRVTYLTRAVAARRA